MTNKSTPDVIKELRQGFVDFALVSGPIEDDDNLYVREVASFREDVICGREIYESSIKGKSLTFEELCEIPLVAMDKGTASYEFYRKFLSEKGVAFTVDTYVATVDQILPMVIYNMGIGFVSEKFIPESFYGKEIYKVDMEEPMPLRKIFFVKRKTEALTIAAKELKRLIFELEQK